MVADFDVISLLYSPHAFSHYNSILFCVCEFHRVRFWM